MLDQTTRTSLSSGSWPCTYLFLGSAWMDSNHCRPETAHASRSLALVKPLHTLFAYNFLLPIHQGWEQNIHLLTNTSRGHDEVGLCRLFCVFFPLKLTNLKTKNSYKITLCFGRNLWDLPAAFNGFMRKYLDRIKVSHQFPAYCPY